MAYEIKLSPEWQRLYDAMKRSDERLRAKRAGREVTLTGQILPKPSERGCVSPLDGRSQSWWGGKR